MPTDKLLELEGLTKYFYKPMGLLGRRKQVVQSVDHVSFHILRHETFGLVGESGCGKSQTLRSILGLLKQPGRITGGEIRYKGADIAKMSQRELQKIRGKEISMIFQEPMTALNPVLRIRSQMYEAFEGEKLSKEEKRRRAIELLKLVGIPSPETRLDEYPHQFSGGMRQRAMIAIALGARPKLLLADEPTTALDVTIQAQIIDLMVELKKNINASIILITHDMGVVAEMADYIMVMYAGKVMEYGSARQIFKEAMHPYTQGLLASIPRLDKDLDRLFSIDGTVPSLDRMPKGCRFCARCLQAMDKCREHQPPVYITDDGHKVSCWKYENLKEEKV